MDRPLVHLCCLLGSQTSLPCRRTFATQVSKTTQEVSISCLRPLDCRCVLSFTRTCLTERAILGKSSALWPATLDQNQHQHQCARTPVCLLYLHSYCSQTLLVSCLQRLLRGCLLRSCNTAEVTYCVRVRHSPRLGATCCCGQCPRHSRWHSPFKSRIQRQANAAPSSKHTRSIPADPLGRRRFRQG